MSSIMSGVGSFLTGDAAGAQQQFSNQGIAVEQAQKNENTANAQPYMTAGNTATTNALNLAKLRARNVLSE